MEGVNGVLAEIDSGGKNIMMKDGGCQFQVAVGNSTGGVGIGDEAILDARRDRCPPDQWGHAGGLMDKCNAAHAVARGVCCPNHTWLPGDELCNSCWTRVQVLREGPEVIQESVYRGCQAQAAVT